MPWPRFPSATVIAGDILQLDLAEIVSPYLKPDTRLRIAGNLPYNIATVIIEKLLRIDLPIQDMWLSWCSSKLHSASLRGPGQETTAIFRWSASIIPTFDWDSRYRRRVLCPAPRSVPQWFPFSLKPKTWDSALESDFEAHGQGGFQPPTKNAGEFPVETPGPGKRSSLLLARAGIDGSRRAEELSVQEYEHLAQTYHTIAHDWRRIAKWPLPDAIVALRLPPYWAILRR